MSKIIFASILAGFTMIFLCLTSVLVSARQALADSKVNPSDAQFDQRLPPVLPGEEVSDGKKTMKLWSTSGPVPVMQITPTPHNGTNEWGVPGSVIIDGRSGVPNFDRNSENGAVQAPEKRY